MQLLDTFGVNEKNIKNLHMVFSNGDCHNRGKSPVFLNFTIQDQSVEKVIKLVYKPRSTIFEQKIQNTQDSFCQKISSTTNYHFGTYRIVSVNSEGESHGYCEFVEGRPVYDEDAESGYPDFVSQSLDFSQFQESWIATENSDDPIKAKQELSTENYFFSQRTTDQLGIDLFYFTALNEIGAGDTHGANFIENQSLYFIDAECFDDERYTSAADAVFLIEAAYTAKNEPLTDTSSFKQKIQPFVEEFNKLKEAEPIRYVPLDTERFYQMRNQFIAFGGMDVSSLLEALKAAITNGPANRKFEIIGEEDHGFSLDLTPLEKQMADCFNQFDIPYFTIDKNIILLNGIQVAKEKT